MKNAILVLPLVLAACAAEPDPAEVGSQSQASWSLVPVPCCADPQEAHFAYTGNPLTANGKYLVVFLHGGAGNHPINYVGFMENANDQGFYVLGLSFRAPTQLMSQMCPTGLDCQGDARNEIWDGSDHGVAGFPQSPAASIKTRLDDAIDDLIAQDSQWSRFRQNGHPFWERIIMVGHGGGNAVWIAKKKPVARALTVGPFGDGHTDGNGVFTPANWVTDPTTQTPGTDVYGLFHWNDPYSPLSTALTQMDALAPGNPYCVAGSCINLSCPFVPYCDSRQLTSKAPKASWTQNEHYDVAQNEAQYAGVWTYMLTRNLPAAP